MRSTWVAQLVKHLTPDFGSGYDLGVCGTELCVGLQADSMDHACYTLHSICPSPGWISLSLSENIFFNYEACKEVGK